MNVERPTVRVLMSPELMAEWATRDTRGNLLTWNWDQDDGDGFRTPTVTTHEDDNLAKSARRSVLLELRATVEGLGEHWVSGAEWDCETAQYGPNCEIHQYTTADPFLDRADVLSAIDHLLGDEA